MSAFARICLDCSAKFRPTSQAERRCRRCRQRLYRQRKAQGLRTGSTPQWRAIRAAVLSRDKGRCHYCGDPARTVDHVVPLAKDGSDDPANLVAACDRCNYSKGAQIG